MLKKLLPFLGIVIFAYVIYRIGLGNLYDSLIYVNIYYIIFAFFLTIIYVLMQTWKWDVILKKQGIAVDFYELLKMQLKSIFYGVITPGRLGSFIKALDLKNKINANLGKSISSVLIDRIFDTISVFLLAFAGALFLVNKVLNLSYVVFLFFIFVLASAYAIFNKNLTKKILGFFYDRFLPEKFKKDVRESFYSFYENLPSKRLLVVPFIVNFMTWIVAYTGVYVISLALGIEINYFVLITLYSITTVISIIPITVAGIGTREVSLIALFNGFGVSNDKIVALSLLAFLISGIIPALIGFLFTLKNGKIHETRQ